MRVGIVRSSADISRGGIFSYEQAFLDALSEIASGFAGEFVYLTVGKAILQRSRISVDLIIAA